MRLTRTIRRRRPDLNYEHIISGHNDPANWFAPRNGIYRMYRLADPNSVMLVRRHEDDPWALESTMTYTVTAPHYIDFEFSCRPHDARRFGDRRYALLFWADYMNNVDDVALHFRGVNEPGGAEQWIAADAPTGHPDYVGGGTYRHVAAPATRVRCGPQSQTERVELRVSPFHAALLLRPARNTA